MAAIVHYDEVPGLRRAQVFKHGGEVDLIVDLVVVAIVLYSDLGAPTNLVVVRPTRRAIPDGGLRMMLFDELASDAEGAGAARGLDGGESILDRFSAVLAQSDGGGAVAVIRQALHPDVFLALLQVDAFLLGNFYRCHDRRNAIRIAIDADAKVDLLFRGARIGVV